MKDYILLIDNNKTNIDFYHKVFPAIHRDYLIASNKNQALGYLSDYNIAVVIIDSEVEEMKGYEVLKTIRKEDDHHDIPIILLSDIYIKDLHTQSDFHHGTIDYIIKPLIPEIVKKKISSYIELFTHRKSKKLIKGSAEQTLSKLITNENLVLNSANDILQNAMSLYSLEEAARYIVDMCLVVGHCHCVSLLESKDNKFDLLSKKVTGIYSDVPSETIINCANKNYDNIIKHGNVRILSGRQMYRSTNDKKLLEFSSFISVPLYFEEKIFGLLFMVKKNDKFTEIDVENFDVLSSTIVNILTRKKIELELESYKNNLERKVNERTRELKLKNRQLNIEKRERLSAVNILNATPIVAFRWKNVPGLAIEYVSDNIVNVTGYTVTELISGKVGVKDLVHPEDYDRVNKEVKEFSKIREKAYFHHKPFRVIIKDGSVIWVDERLILIRDKKGCITHFQGVLFDITEKLKHDLEMNRLTTAISQLSSSVVITDIYGDIVYINPYFTTITGYTEEEVLGKNPRILKSDFTSPEEYKELWDTITSGNTWRGEFINIRKDGSEYWESAIIAPVVDNTGKIINYVALKKDITDQKRIERQLQVKTKSLRESEELFRTLSDASFESIFISEDGVCLLQNNTAEQMFGYTLEEAALKPIVNWVIPEHRDLVREKILQGVTEPYTVLGLKKDGTTFPCEVKARNSYYHDKRVRISSFSDISIRVRAQKRLVESEKQYKSFIRDNHSVIMAIDAMNGKIVDANNACCTFYGYSFEDILEMSIFNLTTHSRKEASETLRAIRNGEKNYYVSKHHLANGEQCDVEIYAGKIRYANKEVVLCIIHDLTEKVRIQKELVIAKQRAEESDKLKTSFLANMSHEIRTPMNAIIGFSQLLNIPGISIEERVGYIDTINNSGKQLLSLIDDIISISQIEAGIMEIHKKTVSVGKLLKTVHKYFILTAQDKKIEFNYYNEMPPDLSTISTDPHRVQQVLINLLSNAFKFTKEGSVEFGCFYNGNNVEFYVRDTGIGISNGDRNRIFERFMQVDHGEEIIYGGTGIGLSISKAIIEKLNGNIYLVDKKPPGAEFRFTIPFIPVKVEDGNVSDSGSNIMKNTSLKGVKVLIAEDEDNNYELINILIRNSGATSMRAFSGEEAIEILKIHKDIDIVLMDIKMPKVNGIKATQCIRELGVNVPIIAQTAYAQTGDRDDFLNAGCDDYISKPIVGKDLLNKINRLLTKN